LMLLLPARRYAAAAITLYTPVTICLRHYYAYDAAAMPCRCYLLMLMLMRIRYYYFAMLLMPLIADMLLMLLLPCCC